MPRYTVGATDESTGAERTYEIYSRDKLDDSAIETYASQLHNRGQLFNQGQQIYGQEIDTSKGPSRSFLLRRAYDENVGAPISRGLESLTQNPDIQEAVGAMGLSSLAPDLASPDIGISQSQLGKGMLELGSSAVTHYTDDPVNIAVDAATLALTKGLGGNVISPFAEVAATQGRRLKQVILPGMLAGLATTSAELALDPNAQRNEAVSTGMQAGALIAKVNALFQFAPSLMKSISSKVDSATEQRLAREFDRMLGTKANLSNDPIAYQKQVAQGIEKLSEKSFEASIDEISKIVRAGTDEGLSNTFKAKALELKDTYVSLSKAKLGSDEAKDLTQQVISLLDDTKKIALQSTDDVLPYIVSRDKDMLQDMLRLGYIDDKGYEALSRNAGYLQRTLNTSQRNFNQAAKLADTPQELKDAMAQYIANGKGRIAQVRQIQQLQNLQQWQAAMQEVLKNTSELAQYKNIAEIVLSNPRDTTALRRALASYAHSYQPPDTEKLLEAVFDSSLAQVRSGGLDAGFYLRRRGSSRGIGVGKNNNFLPSSGVTQFNPSRSGAINSLVIKSIRETE